ncbi:type 1 glutamine amidotransferase domain-containing protein [Pseudomonas sp. FSL R10-0056]|uniref:type 1 glutamine amidotransferase domain-containing protein n=1 Tax=unclassified Pseudomonas TaxID=196821 RepID=UPI001296E8DC|nr:MULTISPECIES: type 1 glutamine amidotransferase domain-containing protein [unclassified Pseudomonas]MQT61582.1 type 1 glutamine amidotransferase domain-containing protein [Pseudomonas sp. FSL R10-0056]MQT70822.1 type 1 glutamine amidotransferase domain-containing protein [Pseudomonas sp. FSL R10-0071]MQU50041.1 type 1 glutamine amidotransferase domain-containing protein [Pseudomonas sp. FSL A6-1183]
MKLLKVLAISTVVGGASFTVQAAKVLVVLSDASELELKYGQSVSTGFYFNELMQPVKMLLDAGHTLTFATPLGRAPTMDKGSFDTSYFGGSVEALNDHKALMDRLKITAVTESPVVSLSRIEQMGYAQFDALYVPGGRAPLQDLATSKSMGRLLTSFHERGKPTALVCHGPVALLSTLPDASGFVEQLEISKGKTPVPDWIYAGYKMTVMNNVEEKLAQRRLQGGEMKYMPQTAFEQAGGDYKSALVPFSSFMVSDRELITGQNPASTTQVAEELLKRLH